MSRRLMVLRGGMIMNKIEKAFSTIDYKVDKRLGFLKSFFKKYFTIISTVLLCTFMLLFVLRVFYTRPSLIASIIEDDINLIVLSLKKIDDTCNILSVDDENNEVDFLNVKSFVGSRVGALTLAYPDRWEGPYLNINPTIQDQHYQIVKAGDGIFVMPGNGVKLPNGKVIGKDFKVSRGTIVAELLKQNGALRYDDKLLAEKLIFKIGDWDPWHLKKETVKSLDRMIREFNEAMPYTKNDVMSN